MKDKIKVRLNSFKNLVKTIIDFYKDEFKMQSGRIAFIARIGVYLSGIFQFIIKSSISTCIYAITLPIFLTLFNYFFSTQSKNLFKLSEELYDICNENFRLKTKLQEYEELLQNEDSKNVKTN